MARRGLFDALLKKRSWFDPALYKQGLYDDNFVAVSVSCAVTGTAAAAITEADIVAGGKTIILTLTGDTWVAAGATFDAQRANIIAGLDSAQSEATGWDAVVKALQGVAGVVRTSDTVVTITLDAQATYNITAQETITVTVPASALALGGAVVAAPTFTVAESGAAEVYFSMLHRIERGMVAQTAASLGGVLVE
jgi:hypothetical protein